MIIDLKNKDVLSKLDAVLVEWKEKFDGIGIPITEMKTFSDPLPIGKLGDGSTSRRPPPEDKSGFKHRTSEETFRKEYLPYADDHIGYPVEWYSVATEDLRDWYNENDQWDGLNNYVRYDLAAELGAAANALFSFYPPKGFIGWHTNWNAYSYQVLFTWSETGDGYFSYYDVPNDEVIIVPDKKGWSAKTYFFAPKEDTQNHCWHTAYTECDRMTLCYKFTNWGGRGTERDEQALAWRNDFVEFLETE